MTGGREGNAEQREEKESSNKGWMREGGKARVERVRVKEELKVEKGINEDEGEKGRER